jgi:uncharacterized OB-fold protein
MGQPLKDVVGIIGDERPRVMRYSYSAGPVRSKFLLSLRDQQKILGTRCPTCGRVYVPARSSCPKCFENLEEWVEVSHEGILESYTIVYKSEPIHITDTPFALGIIKLNGADTGIVHRLGEIDFKKIRIGMRVRAVFNEERKGDIRDIKYFKPVRSKRAKK